MNNIIKSTDNLKIIWRKGDTNDPFIPISEQVRIVNNMATLREIPDEFYRVLITNYTEVFDVKDLTSDKFIVNYQNGTVLFHASRNGNTVQTSYRGKGIIMYPASRIYTSSDNPDLITNVQEIIDSSKTGLDALVEVRANEDSRIANENARKSAEVQRTQSEQTRQTNESQRGQNETTRQSQEQGRIGAESIRVTQENNRQSAINNLTHLSNYSSSTTYQPRNMVLYNGSTYMCTVAATNVLPTNTSNWRLVAQKGTDGTNLAYKGQYNASTNYVVGDLVTYEGNTYTCTQNTSNRLPTVTTHWSLFNSKTVMEIISEEFTSAENQTVFNLTKGQYIPNHNLISLYIMGIKQPVSLFTETSPTRITLLKGLPQGAKVLFEYFNVVNVDLNANEELRKTNETTRQANEASRITTETSRVSAESSRVNVEINRVSAEASRVSAESTRVSNENTRQSNETTRNTKENERLLAENTRSNNESTRITDENTRKANETNRIGAETDRVSKESTRVSNENARQTKEATRESNETTRIQAENTRLTNETDRVNKETVRITKENERLNAEAVRVDNENTRKANESARQTQETSRQSNEVARINNENERITRINDFNHVGEYLDTISYKPLNIVSFFGSGYICIQGTVGNNPLNTTYWKLIAQKGSEITKEEIEVKLTGTITTHTHNASSLIQTSTHRLVSDAEKNNWNAKSDLALGETSSTAYRGDRGKTAFDHSQTAHAPSNAQKNSDITKAEIEAKLTGTIATHMHQVYHVGVAAPSNTNMIWIEKV